MGGVWDGREFQRGKDKRKKDKRGAANGTATGKGIRSALLNSL